MRWTTPDLTELDLNGEVTAYSNTDGDVRPRESEFARTELVIVASGIVAYDRVEEAST